MHVCMSMCLCVCVCLFLSVSVSVFFFWGVGFLFCWFCVFYYWNISFFHIIHPKYNCSSLHFSYLLPHLPSPLDSFPLYFLIERADLLEITVKQNKILWQSKSPHIVTIQSNQTERKMSQEQTKESEIRVFPLLGVTEKHQANSHNIHVDQDSAVLAFLWVHVSPPHLTWWTVFSSILWLLQSFLP